MKKYLPILVSLSVLLSAVSVVNAQGPAGDWISSIACQNIDQSNGAEIMITFYSEGDGSAVASYSDAIPAGGSKNYYTTDPDLAVPENFVGSVVVTSLQPVICTVNSQTTGEGTSESPYRIATSSGLDEAEIATEMYAPQVMKDYYSWNSYISVQNTSPESITVTIDYKDKAGEDIPAASETATIPGFSNTIFYQSENAELPGEYVGSAKVSVANPADAKMAILVNFYNSSTDSGTSQFHSYNGFSSGATKLYVPRVVRRFYGYNSGITVQNVSDVDTSVTITFNFAGQAYTYQSPNISPNVALVLYMADVSETDGVDSLPINQRFGNAVIEVNNPDARIVGIINEDNRGNLADNDGNIITAERIGQGSTYSAIPAGSETMRVYFPQVPKNVDSVFSGGFYISNVTSTAGICDIYFMDVPGAKLNDVPMAANGSLSYYLPDLPNVPDGFNAAVSAHCNMEVIGIQNFAAAPGTEKLGDSFTQNNGFNK